MKKILHTCLLVSIFNFCYAQIPTYIPSANLVGWWPMNSNLIDSSNNSYDGVGSLFTYTADRFGSPASSCDFSNLSANVQFEELPVNTNGTYSINFWVNLKTYGDYDVIMDFHPGDLCGNYPQIWEMYDSLYIVKCGVPSSRKPIGSKADFVNKWKMVTWLVKSDSTFVYIDGALKSRFPYTWASSSTVGLTVANGYNSVNTFNKGSKIIADDIALWDRLLTDCEISNLFLSAPNTSIVTQPSNQNNTVGGTATFAVATNNPTASYQWQSNIGTSGTFINLSNIGQYSGVNNDTLSVSPLTVTNNNQLFRCIISNEAGQCPVVSNVVSITINGTGIDLPDYLIGSSLGQNIPNPATSSTSISYNVRSLKNNAYLRIWDVSGKSIYTYPISNKGNGHTEIDISNLEKGIYFYTLVIDGIQVAQKKMAVL